MRKPAARHLQVLLALGIVSMPVAVLARSGRQIQAQDEGAYGSKFFDQLRSIFGVFRDSDLRRAFQTAQPIQCQELVVSKGQWRTVAFFNEDRSLGEWCRENIEEVKSDLSVYTFKGSCIGDRGSVQVATEFPVAASIDAYNEGKIPLSQIDININAPVTAAFDPTTQAYRFELPYLFLISRRADGNVYSLVAPRVEDAYAPDVLHRWECKSVKSNDVTYRFLICHTTTVPRSVPAGKQVMSPRFGASAYFILSDGMEAQTSVNVSFGGGAPAADNSKATDTPKPTPARPVLTREKTIRPVGTWQMPDVRSKVADVGKDEFRLRFSPQTWTGKIGYPAFLSDQKLSSARPAGLPDGSDYCAWRPGAADLAARLLTNEPGADIQYSVAEAEKSSRNVASILFDMKTQSGIHLGTLQCYFPRAESAATIDFDRWVSIVGSHLMLEVRR